MHALVHIGMVQLASEGITSAPPTTVKVVAVTRLRNPNPVNDIPRPITQDADTAKAACCEQQRAQFEAETFACRRVMRHDAVRYWEPTNATVP